jgi:hypothetical protein
MSKLGDEKPCVNLPKRARLDLLTRLTLQRLVNAFSEARLPIRLQASTSGRVMRTKPK